MNKNKVMNETPNTIANPPWLTPWQRRAVIIVGAVAGAIAAAAVIRWLDCRRAGRRAGHRQNETSES
jgi:hypothetical protein